MDATRGWRLRRGIELWLIRLLGGLAWLTVKLVPRAAAYDALISLSGSISAWSNSAYAFFRPNRAMRDYRAILIRNMLSTATHAGGIPIRVEVLGGEILDRFYARHGRVILCTAHFGLTMAMFSVLEARGLRAAAVGEVEGKRDRLHWGCRAPANLIESDRVCLVRARHALEAGEVLIVYPDRDLSPADHPPTGESGIGIFPNVFSFARLVEVPMLFFGARLGESGAIVIEIVEPVHHTVQDETGIAALAEEFRRFVEARSQRRCIMLDAAEYAVAESGKTAAIPPARLWWRQPRLRAAHRAMPPDARRARAP